MVKGLAQIAPVLNAAVQGNPEALTQVAGVIRAMPGALGEQAKKYAPSRIGDTLYNEPLTSLMDASTLLTGVGGLGRAAATKAPGLLRAANMATRAGELIDPVRAAVAVPATVLSHTVRPATSTMQRWGTGWMQSAVKNAKQINDQNIHNVSEVMARERIMPTPEGFVKAADKAKGLRRAAYGKAREAKQEGRAVDPSAITRRMDRETGRLSAVDQVGDRYVDAMRGVRDKFWEKNSVPTQEDCIVRGPCA
jgi:hypothetical protein